MDKLKFLCILTLTSGIVSGCVGYRGVEQNEVVYKWKAGNLLHVFNVSRMLFSEEGESYLLRRDGAYSDFGGDFIYCDSEKYLCMVGGIAAAVPKEISGQVEWSFENWQCHSNMPIRKNILNSVSCSYRGQVTEFLYDSVRGVVSYKNRGKATEKEMQLLGEKGLLSSSKTLPR